MEFIKFIESLINRKDPDRSAQLIMEPPDEVTIWVTVQYERCKQTQVEQQIN